MESWLSASIQDHPSPSPTIRSRSIVWKFFEPDGTFRHWYINFEAPVIRGDGLFDVDDHGLDLISEEDGSRIWKDVEDLHHQRAEGRIDLDTVGTVLAAAAKVSNLLDTGEPLVEAMGPMDALSSSSRHRKTFCVSSRA